MPNSTSNSTKQVQEDSKDHTTEFEDESEDLQKFSQNYKVKMKYIKMMLKQKSTEDEFDSSDLDLDYDEYLFKKTKNPSIRKKKKRRKRYQLNKNPEISFLSPDTKLHVLNIIKKGKTKEMKILNKKRLLKTAEQAKKTSDIFKILYDSKKHTKEGQRMIKTMEDTLGKIEKEANDWDNF